MTWLLAAAVVALAHAAYLLFQTLGGLLALRGRRWLWPHLAAVSWGVGIVVVQGHCPLTVLERYLIGRSGETPYQGSYLDHYVFGRVLPDGTQWWIYAGHLVVIVLSYVVVLRNGRGSPTTVMPPPVVGRVRG